MTRALDEEGQALAGGLPTTAGSRILEGYRSPYASVGARSAWTRPARC